MPGRSMLTVTDAFEAAFNSRTPFQCCRQQVDVGILADYLPRAFVDQYRLLILELGTPNAEYCSNRTCGRFLPPSLPRGPDTIQCSQCNHLTCRHCRDAAHGNTECPADLDAQMFRTLAASRGWKACPQCRKMVEKTSGCNHMSCTCRAQFCYKCGRLYSICSGTC